MVSNFYREEVCFTAQYPEAKGHVFTLLSYGSQDSSLENYNTSLKIYLAKTKTGKYWSTKDILLEILSSFQQFHIFCQRIVYLEAGDESMLGASDFKL